MTNFVDEVSAARITLKWESWRWTIWALTSFSKTGAEISSPPSSLISDSNSDIFSKDMALVAQFLFSKIKLDWKTLLLHIYLILSFLYKELYVFLPHRLISRFAFNLLEIPKKIIKTEWAWFYLSPTFTKLKYFWLHRLCFLMLLSLLRRFCLWFLDNFSRSPCRVKRIKLRNKNRQPACMYVS